MRGYRGFTRSGNDKGGKSGARLRRVIERNNKDGWARRTGTTHAQYERWEKSFQNIMVVDDGATYWRFSAPQLIHKGRKP